MKKFKPLCLFTFFMLCLVEIGFSQNVHFQKDLTKKDNLWYSGEELYTGEVITLSMDQIETRYSVEKGVPSGLFTKYFLDYNFKKSNYKDTSEIRRLNQAIVIENNKLNSLIKDSLMAYNDLILYINNEIGGDKKLLKLVVKKEENKLNEKQKVLMDNFAFKVNFWKNSSQNVLLSQQKIMLTNTKLKEEEAKPVVAPKISEQYEQVNSIKNGSYKSYFGNGSLESEGTFLDGFYHGAWTFYHSMRRTVIIFDGSECLNKVLGIKTALARIRDDNPALADDMESVLTFGIDATNAAAYRQDFRDLAELFRNSGLDMNDASNKKILEIFECKADMADELSKTEMEKPYECKCCICIEKDGCFSFKRR